MRPDIRLAERLPGADNGGPGGDGVMPAGEVGIFIEADLAHALEMGFGIHRDIGHRVVTGKIFVVGQVPVHGREHVEKHGFVVDLRLGHVVG